MIAKKEYGRTWNEVRLVLFALAHNDRKIYTTITVSNPGTLFGEMDLFSKVRPILDKLCILYERGTDDKGPYFKIIGHAKS